MAVRISYILYMAVMAIILLCGCGRYGKERNHPFFVKARNFRNQSRYADAAEYYEKYLYVNPKSAKTHYELAMLYQDHLDDPLLAVYHYRKYLKLAPESLDAETISKWLSAAERSYYEQLKGKYSSGKPEDRREIQEELSKERKLNKKYREALFKLKKKMEQYRDQSSLPEIPRKKPETASRLKEDGTEQNSLKIENRNENSIPEFYTIQKGDTLHKIAKRFYGDSKYYSNIFRANSQLVSPSRLKIGEKLKLPRPESN